MSPLAILTAPIVMWTGLIGYLILVWVMVLVLADEPVFTRAAVADLRTVLAAAAHSHRKPSALARLFRDWWSRPGRPEPSCRACSDADEGPCTCPADCDHVRCTGGFR